jgi:hypothetical protein
MLEPEPEGNPKKKRRNGGRSYVHDPSAHDISLASTARKTRVEVVKNRAPPPSPEKSAGRAYDLFDQAMGYSPDDNMFDASPRLSAMPDGVAGISIKEKKKKAPRYEDSVSKFIVQ